MNALLRSYYAEFGYWFQAEILDINGKTFTSANQYNEEGALLPATISGPASLANPRQLQIRLRNLSIRPNTFANLQFILMYYQNQEGVWARLPRYTKTCPLPAIGSEVVVTLDQIYGDIVPEIWVPGVYDIFIGVYGNLASGFQYGIGGIEILDAVSLPYTPPIDGGNSVVVLTAPVASALAGAVVPITAFIRNTTIYPISFNLTCGIQGSEELLDEAFTLAAGESRSWDTSFVMPNHDVTLYLTSLYYGADGMYHQDAQTTKMVSLEIPPPPPTPFLGVSPAFVAQGGTMQYSFAGFHPNSAISMFIQGGQGWAAMSNANGSGSGSMVIATTIPPGTYTLQAEDEYGDWATAMFTVTGAPVPTAAVFSNLRASYYKNTLYNGDPLVVDVTFHHSGAAYTGAKIYVAVWKRTVLDPHNEIEGLNVWSPVIVVPDDSTVGQDYTVTLTIPIRNVGGAGGATPGQYYGVLAKMTGLPFAFPSPDLYWFGIENDINLQAVPPLPSAQFSELQATYRRG